MKPNNTYIIFFLLMTIQSIGQDANFSQFYHAPTIFNAAETGYRSMGGKFRINGVHKSFGGGFQTTSLAFDGTVDWRDKSFMGLGGAIIQDRTESGGFRNLTILGGVGLHFALDKKDKHYLSIGTQVGVVNNQLRTENLRFESDILGGESESFIETNLINMDSRFGMIYSYFPSEYIQVKLGTGVNHIIPFSDKFITTYSETKTQFAVYFDYNQQFEKWWINPYIIYMSQGTFDQTLIGCTVTRCFNEKGVSVGASYRSPSLFSLNNMNANNILVLVAGFSFSSGTRVYASFDQSLSKLNNSLNNNLGNLELGFQYIINSANNRRTVSPNMLRNQGN
jgi:type IX secretion system PorP/SprF family membrane protein